MEYLYLQNKATITSSINVNMVPFSTLTGLPFTDNIMEFSTITASTIDTTPILLPSQVHVMTYDQAMPTVTFFSTTNTSYTIPENSKYFIVRAVGGGGGGGAGGNSGGAGGDGNATVIDYNGITTIAGGGGGSANCGSAVSACAGIGGAPSGTYTIGITGGAGSIPITQDSSSDIVGGFGGSSVFGDRGGINTSIVENGITPVAGSGYGGSGGSVIHSDTQELAGGGGGAGAYVENIFTVVSDVTTFSVIIGSTGGAGGTGSNYAGSAGAIGSALVTFYY